MWRRDYGGPDSFEEVPMHIRPFAALITAVTLALAVYGGAAAGTTEPPDGTEPAPTETTADAMVDTTGPAGTTETTEAMVDTTAAPGTASPAPIDLPALTVGSADFNESQLLAEIYGQALRLVGFDVSFEHAIGSREVYVGAVDNAEVDLVPEYTGSLLSFLLAPEQPDATTVEEQVAAIGEALPDDLEVLTPSTAEDKDVIVCTQAVADEFGLSNLSSLFDASSNITIGGPPELETRTPFGLAGFRDLYGAEFEGFVPLTVADVSAALSAGAIDCGNLFSTMSAIATEGFVVLEDDLEVVPHEAVLPLVRSEVVGPELTGILDEVNAALDTETLAGLLAQVEVDQLGVDVVAADWLATIFPAGPPATAAPVTTTAAETTMAPDTTMAAETAGAPVDTSTDTTVAPATTG
jgi:osmoprotectant transport system substrate-binding protein